MTLYSTDDDAAFAVDGSMNGNTVNIPKILRVMMQQIVMSGWAFMG